ncbi:MAG: glycosyltransferase [Rhabdochlamydiaceae bacterium]|nr:glycosyltransferase [Candidatus Amphrikana amoebophyrae]
MRLILLVVVIFSLLGMGCSNEKSADQLFEQEFNNLKTKSFTILEGSQTPLWEFVQSEKDRQTLATFEKAYNKRIDAKEASQYRIPNTIHFIWIGPNNFPIESLENIRMWKKHNPTATFKFWTDRPRMAPVAGMDIHYIKDFHFEKLGALFEESKNWAEKADILRLEILEKEGGIYVDHDADCLRSFDSLQKSFDFFAALEPPHDPIGDLAVTIGIGIIGSAPHHPFILKSIEVLESRWKTVTAQFDDKDPLSLATRVMHRTYLPLTLVAQTEIMNHQNSIILPAHYFYPSKYQKAALYSKHYYGTSWNHLGKKSKVKRYYHMLEPFFKHEAAAFRLFLLFALITFIVTVVMLYKIIFRGKYYENVK